MVDNDFSYNMKESDNSIDLINKIENFYGLEKTRPTIFSKDLIDLKNEIFNDLDIMNSLSYENNDIDHLFVNRSTIIWKNFGINHNRVQYYKPNIVFENKIVNGKFTKEFCDGLDEGFPTDIPVEYVDDFQKAMIDTEYIELEKHRSILFKKIILPNIEKKVVSCIYAHEITHANQDMAGGGIKKITNIETLPIFIELLFSKELGVNDKVINHRLGFLAGGIGELLINKDINFEKRIKIETYIISIIQALDLYNKFEENDKAEFINYINQIFSGEKEVEQMLDNYDSNFKDIKPKLKVLKR